MNDIDIIKAAECCFIKKNCADCPLDRGDHVHSCIKDLQQTIPDFMNRLKTERDNLYKENLELKDGYFQKRYEDTEHQELMGLREAWRNESMRNIDLSAEIENLKAEKDNLIRTYKECQIENLKYFADQIKMRFYYHFDEIIPSIMSDEIDTILKEMESESNAK